MNHKILCLLLIQLFSLVLTKSVASFRITRSKNHEDQSGKLTPLVVSISTDDQSEKMKGVDFILVVDVSSSMSGERISLVKESLKYIVNDLLNEQDNIALIQFSTSASVIRGLTPMTAANKVTLTQDINNLRASGGTNIYTGLTKGLEQITNSYDDGTRICSIILLSDGQDQYRNADINFRNLISSTGKTNYIFTTHTLGMELIMMRF